MRNFCQKHGFRLEIILFFILLSFAAVGNGLSDSIYANYYKEVYEVTTFQRGIIELPRELPGLLCALVIAVLSCFGDLRTAVFAQILSCAGLLILGLFTPTFPVMLFFLFINSMGMHLFMPLQDSIGMNLAEPERVGVRMGQYASLRALVSCATALLVFFGFRFGLFSFASEIKWVFIVGAIAFLCAIFASIALARTAQTTPAQSQKVKFIFRKEYKFYYCLTVLHGVQKQIAFVYGSWVIVELLLKGADTMSLLTIISSFLCIFFMRKIGRWIDTLGIRKMMFVDALSFIIVYCIYGFAVWGITSKLIPDTGIAVWLIYILFILDRLSMQIGMVKSVYLRAIALSPEDITATLSTGTSLDHIVSIIAAIIGGWIWTNFGSHWVFFIAAGFSLGNLYVAFQIKDKPKTAETV